MRFSHWSLVTTYLSAYQPHETIPQPWVLPSLTFFTRNYFFLQYSATFFLYPALYFVVTGIFSFRSFFVKCYFKYCHFASHTSYHGIFYSKYCDCEYFLSDFLIDSSFLAIRFWLLLTILIVFFYAIVFCINIFCFCLQAPLLLSRWNLIAIMVLGVFLSFMLFF